MIKLDVIAAFENAVANPDNIKDDNNVNWDFVSADMHMDLSDFYSSSYINDCMDKLADDYELSQAFDRLRVLKTDYLGMEA